MSTCFHVTDSPTYQVSVGARKLLRKGWRRKAITIYDEETAEKYVTCIMYLPPATNKDALEHMLDLWAQ